MVCRRIFIYIHCHSFNCHSFIVTDFKPGQMELVSLGRQSVYPRVYLASYRGISSAMETMRRSSNRNSVNDVNTTSACSNSGASGRRRREAPRVVITLLDYELRRWNNLADGLAIHGSGLLLMTWQNPTLGFRKQEWQLRTGLSGGCLRSIAQRTRSGARSYWIYGSNRRTIMQ